MTTHLMFDGRVQIYRRGEGRVWQCAARVGGERFRQSTNEEDLDRAKDVAEEWYLDLRGKLRHGEIIKKERTFAEAAEHYLSQARVLAVHSRSPAYISNMELRMKVHLLPFFGASPLPEINRGLLLSYLVKRTETGVARSKAKALARAKTPEEQKAVTGKPPSRSTLEQEIVHVRQVLKHAAGLGWISFVPDLTLPYGSKGRRERRAWFSPEEYEQLYKATRQRVADCPRRGWKPHYEELHDYVLFMANSGLRPDEAKRLEFRDVVIEDDYATGQTILVIDVRGKTGVGYCKTMPGAVQPFRRLRDRREDELDRRKKASGGPRRLEPTDRVFRKFNRDLFNAILREEGLKHDRDGRVRTAYSLRHTYISMRLMEGADVYQIANNCRTSVQMIEEFYAAHIKNRLDTTSINVQRPQAVKKAIKRQQQARKSLSTEGDGPNP